MRRFGFTIIGQTRDGVSLIDKDGATQYFNPHPGQLHPDALGMLTRLFLKNRGFDIEDADAAPKLA